MKKPSASLWKSARLGLIILAILIVYAYGFQVTQVDLEEFRKESRQESRVRVTRALARPDIFEYDQEVFITFTPIYVPCPSVELDLPEPDTAVSYLEVTPPCNDPDANVQVEGFNLPPGTEGPISFVPSTDPESNLALQRGRVEVDSQGKFKVDIELPPRPSEEIQYIRVTVRRNVGLPKLTDTAYQTWDKIIETVFLALLATTIGTILAVPVSFIAARNIMRDVKSPLGSIALSLIAWPIGILLGFLVTSWVRNASDYVSANIWSNVLGTIFSPTLGLVIARWVLFRDEDNEESPLRQSTRIPAILLVALTACFALFQISALSVQIGAVLMDSLGVLGFLGNFVLQMGDILGLLAPAIIALTTGGVLGNLGGQVGQAYTERLPDRPVKTLNIILSAFAGAIIFGIFASGINWLYEFSNPLQIVLVIAGIGMLSGVGLAWRAPAKESLRIGIVLYYLTRTILNAVRSIEALVMAIVAVIWVGIGPFAGTLALALHTIAALGKLYSEQVESILPGPLEAVQATGANRLQTIVYAVVPQIIPPYISFTMYRWDINVRMSTIIGFAGGGGIGFLLQQNINLLNYRAASAQMLAIAIVVASMDYISSTLRERYV